MTRTGNATRVEINELTAVRLVHEAERTRLLSRRFQRAEMTEFAEALEQIAVHQEQLSVILRARLRRLQHEKGGV